MARRASSWQKLSGLGWAVTTAARIAGVWHRTGSHPPDTGGTSQKLSEVNVAKRLVRQLPSPDQVKEWVAQAADLPRVITH